MRRHLALLLIASAFTFFVGLGRAAISDADEAFYAEAAREMVESGNWLTPYYNYELRFQKPILYYWAAAASFALVGPGEAAARFPSACAGLALVLLTWTCGRRWFDERTGVIAGLITATNFGYFALARMALPDLPLAALLTLATWCAIEASDDSTTVDSPDASGGRSCALIVAASAAALAVLTKGPVGVVLPIVTVLLLVRAGLLGRARWLPRSAGPLAIAAIVFVAIAAPWFLAMAREHGVAYLHRFFVGENLERFATERYNDQRSVLFYFPIVLGGLLPWSPFLLLWVPGLTQSLRRRAGHGSRRTISLAIWAAVPFVFYSLSVGKQPRYVLPVLPPLAILLAAPMASRLSRLEASPRSDPLLASCGSLAGLLLASLGVLLWRAAPLLEAFTTQGTQTAALAVVAVGLSVPLIAWVWTTRIAAAVALASTVTLLALQFTAFSAKGAEPVQRMATAYRAARQGSEPSATYHVFVRNLIFYTGVPQTDITQMDQLAAFLRQPARALCVLRERDRQQLAAEFGMEPRILYSTRYFNPAAARLDTLLWPRPQRDMGVVHLIANH